MSETSFSKPAGYKNINHSCTVSHHNPNTNDVNPNDVNTNDVSPNPSNSNQANPNPSNYNQ